MTTRLVSVVVDAENPPALARFWSDALGWPIATDEPDEVEVAPPDGEAPALVFVPVDQPERAVRRIHIDLSSSSLADQEATVARLRARGATPLDVGQGSADWVVLADPEGNAFCVLEPRTVYADAGAVAAIVFHADRPHDLAPFWAAASGWSIVGEDDNSVSLRRPDGRGPFLELLAAGIGPKTAKIPIHLDVAPYADDDQAAEVDRLVALGARPTNVGQGEVTWRVLADPVGNELCVLSARD